MLHKNIASAEENRLETDARSASSDMDAVDGHGVLGGTVPPPLLLYSCLLLSWPLAVQLAHKSVKNYYYRYHQ
jgi:hypothetical protein